MRALVCIVLLVVSVTVDASCGTNGLCGYSRKCDNGKPTNDPKYLCSCYSKSPKCTCGIRPVTGAITCILDLNGDLVEIKSITAEDSISECESLRLGEGSTL